MTAMRWLPFVYSFYSYAMIRPSLNTDIDDLFPPVRGQGEWHEYAPKNTVKTRLLVEAKYFDGNGWPSMGDIQAWQTTMHRQFCAALDIPMIGVFYCVPEYYNGTDVPKPTMTTDAFDWWNARQGDRAFFDLFTFFVAVQNNMAFKACWDAITNERIAYRTDGDTHHVLSLTSKAYVRFVARFLEEAP